MTQVDASQERLPAAGHVFESKYRIVDLIGAGGFARVYRANFEDVGRDVAIKVLVPQFSPPNLYPQELVQRFHREARAVADLKSAHTVTLHDFGRSESGLLYMVFEFVDGTPLDVMVQKFGALGADRTAKILQQTLHSIREAHTVGILHRDIKPANIMLFDYLDETDKVKVLDFGIAKHWTHEADGSPLLPDLTEDGTVIGTPRYMSPEQIVGQRLTPATDIYSLGLVTYEMLTGRLAVPEDVKSDVVRRHLGPEPFFLPDDIPVPPGLAAIVHKMLHKDFRERYQSAAELQQDLKRWVETGASAAQATSSQEATSPEIPTNRPRQNPTPFYNPAVSPGDAASANDPTEITGTPDFGPGQSGNMGQTQPADLRGAPSRPPSSNNFQNTVAPSQSMVPKPDRVVLQVKQQQGRFEIHAPMHPTQRSLVIAGATGLFFAVAIVAPFGGFFIVLLTAIAFAWGLSMALRSYTSVVQPDVGYEWTMDVFGLNRQKRGPFGAVVRFEARGTDDEDNTVLKLVTHDGEFTVANGFSAAENEWAAAEGNAWLEGRRLEQSGQQATSNTSGPFPASQ